MESGETGLSFSNTLTPTPAFNLFSYMYYYNGSGVGAGDFNQDGLIDLFFASNQSGLVLYMNKGEMHFEDVTARSGIPQTRYWHTGVSVADINSDGLLDIYVCAVGQYKSLQGKNLLFICDSIDGVGIPHYSEQAAAYGIAFSGFSTQAAFIDYDRDNDLDLFLLNHSVNHDGNYAPRKNFLNTYDSLAGHRFYRNESHRMQDGRTKTVFSDVTRESGIHSSRIGYGLGVAVADIDMDGWQDIYVGNDFHENDYLYINQRNGTFSDESTKQLAHTSQFSMGVDVADINNDAFPDIISMDMLPYEPGMLKRSLSEDDYTIFQEKIRYGYSFQYARNNLQLNRRNGFFSEVGQYAGIYATDWSWAALWMDFNNDRRKDLFVSNGIPKRMNDIDYVNFVSSDVIQQKLRENTIRDKDLSLTNTFPEIKIPNRFFLNKGAFRFDDVSDRTNKERPTFSNGAVYADFDSDGDLDIVVSNINEPALLYRNTTNTSARRTPYASISLRGPDGNTQGLGAKLILFEKGEVVTYEQQAVHGFQSSMQASLLVGLGDAQIDSALLVWPDQSYQRLEMRDALNDTVIYQPGLPQYDLNRLRFTASMNSIQAFEDITRASSIDHVHRENPFNEFDRETLMPRMVSTEGPALAVADINHDGREDVFIGASKTFHPAIRLQQPGGTFIELKQPAWNNDSMQEHVDAIWVDVNADTHPDLVIATGGNEYYGQDPHLAPLLYLNDGKGNLAQKQNAFPPIYATQSQVVASDFTGDGHPDLFLAGRAVPWNYGAAPRSYLLQNDGKGKFTDVTASYCTDLIEPGMVTSAQWTDLDNDRKNELLLTYEWGGIDAFVFERGKAQKKSLTTAAGWWQHCLPLDVDADGDLDLIATNFGLNSRLKASSEEPVTLYLNDFDDNGSSEQVITYYLNGQEVPFSTKTQLEKRMPLLKKKFLYAADFSKASIADLFGAGKLRSSRKLQANFFSNAVLINDGKMRFTLKELPEAAQWTTYRAASMVNANADALPDILLMGNYYDYNVEIGRQDADQGTLLINKGGGDFMAQSLPGLPIDGQVRKIRTVKIEGRTCYFLARNNGSLMLIRPKDAY